MKSTLKQGLRSARLRRQFDGQPTPEDRDQRLFIEMICLNEHICAIELEDGRADANPESVAVSADSLTLLRSCPPRQPSPA